MPPVHEGAHGPLVDPATSRAEEEGRAGARRDQLRTAARQPGVDRAGGRVPVRHGPLLAALAEDPGDLARPVEVVEVESDQLPDPHPGGVEQLEDREVAQPQRAVLVGQVREPGDQLPRLVLTQHRRQCLVGLR